MGFVYLNGSGPNLRLGILRRKFLVAIALRIALTFGWTQIVDFPKTRICLNADRPLQEAIDVIFSSPLIERITGVPVEGKSRRWDG